MKTLFIDFIDFVETSTPFGSELGRRVFNVMQSMDLYKYELISISLEGILIIDASCVRESLASIAKVHQGKLGVIITNAGVNENDVLFNLESGFKAKNVPLIVKKQKAPALIYSNGNTFSKTLLSQLYKNSEVTTAEMVQALSLSAPNVSSQLKKLANNGFILRSQSTAESGGIEYIYKSFCREPTDIEII